MYLVAYVPGSAAPAQEIWIAHEYERDLFAQRWLETGKYCRIFACDVVGRIVKNYL